MFSFLGIMSQDMSGAKFPAWFFLVFTGMDFAVLIWVILLCCDKI